ncbi:MAG: META domain-containing protein [Cytophagaceae bacterium]|nr:MAG: META domain-containing protein [Cytophagaceae bacterium]
MRFFLPFLLAVAIACQRPISKVTTTTTSNVPEPLSADIADYSRYVRQGIGFLALGNEPFWSLTIQADRQLVFRTPTDSLLLPVPPERVLANGERTYDVKAREAELHVSIRPVGYTDSLSGKLFNHTVEVRVKQGNKASHVYKGGGTSLNQLLLLNDIWVLTSLNGEMIKPVTAGNKVTQGVPQIEIQLTNGRVVGTGGCNRISGQVRADNRYVAFGPIIATRMACPGDANQIESRFTTALQGTLAYHVEKGVLTLSRTGKPIMTFKRTD